MPLALSLAPKLIEFMASATSKQAIACLALRKILLIESATPVKVCAVELVNLIP